MQANKTNIAIARNDLDAGISRIDLKSMFYIIAGKPDCKYKMFASPVLVSRKDIQELNRYVTDKLQNHECDAIIVNISISQGKNFVLDFSDWEEFEGYDFTASECTTSISIKWDFLIKLPDSKAPQRHVMNVRISGSVNPLHILQALVSSDSEQIDRAEIESVPVICRVDFINTVLADELINVVEKWYSSRRKPDDSTPIWSRLKKYRRKIARIIHYSFPTASFILSIVLFFYLSNSWVTEAIQAKFLKHSVLWLFGSLTLLKLCQVLGITIANWVFSGLDQYGKVHIFELSEKDKHKKAEAGKDNKRSVKKVIANIIFTVLVDLSVALVSGWLLYKM